MDSYKSNSLFRPGSNTNLNACVGYNGGPYSYFEYALGYFEAASAILDGIKTRTVRVDLGVYPMVFSFRHAVELALKHFVSALPKLFDESQELVLSHKLEPNWLLVRPYIRREEGFSPSETVPIIDQILKDLEYFDPRGEVFRFPEARSGEMHLGDAAIINVEIVGDAVKECERVMDFWNDRLEEFLQLRLEGWA